MDLNDIAAIGIGVMVMFLIITFAPVVWEDAPKWRQALKHRYTHKRPPRQGSLLAAAVGGAHNQSSHEDWDDDIASVADDVADTATSGVAGVATPQNDNNELLRVAEVAKLDTLAALIHESREKAFQNGEVPETRALKIAFGVSPSSDPRSEYQRLRGELKRRVAQRNPGNAPDQIVDVVGGERGRIVRQTPDGARYVVDEHGARQAA